MRMRFLRFVMAGCALSLLSATARAQQTTPQTEPPQQAEPRQAEQPQSEQSHEEERYEARRVAPTASQLEGRTSLQDYFVTTLTSANKSVIELSQMATEKAQHPEVKRYAEKLITEHQQLNEQLQGLRSQTQAAPRTGETDREGVRERRSDASAERAERRADEDPESRRAERATRRAERTAERGERSAERRDRVSRPREEGASDRRERRAQFAAQGPMVPQQLVQISQQICDKQSQSAKQMLQEKEGQEFDMAYVGMQIVGHDWMVAELQALQNVGSPEFQQLVRQAEQKTQEHLEQAKQLAKTLQGDRPAATQGSESTRPEAGSSQDQ